MVSEHGCCGHRFRLPGQEEKTNNEEDDGAMEGGTCALKLTLKDCVTGPTVCTVYIGHPHRYLGSWLGMMDSRDVDMCNVDYGKLYTLDSLPFPGQGRVSRPAVYGHQVRWPLGWSLTKSDDPTWVCVQSQPNHAAFRVVYRINAFKPQPSAPGFLNANSKHSICKTI